MARTHQLIIHSGLFIALALSSLGMGSMINILRESPLGVHYQTPAQRLLNESSNRINDGENHDGKDKVGGGSGSMVMRKEIKVVAVNELREWQKAERAVIFDVRPNLFYQIGHIPGSHSLQIKVFEQDYQIHKTRIEDAMRQGREIVIYCAGPNCPDASKVAMRLQKMEYRNLSVFEGGWDVWDHSGLEQESSL